MEIMRLRLPTFLVSLPLFAFAMGGQPSVSSYIPAKLVDEVGKVHEVNALTCDDRTYLVFKDGAVEVKIPFQKMEKITVLSKEGEYLEVEVLFKDGTKRTFLISADTLCVGLTKYGTVEAYLSQLKEIDFVEK